MDHSSDSDDAEQKSRLRKIGGKVRNVTRPKQKFTMPNSETGLKVVIATDAWKPQLNGVVTTLDTLGEILTEAGNQVLYITPQDFHSMPMPSYPEIRLSLLPNRKVASMINQFQPDAIHIATEGPIGRATRRFCLRRKFPYTTSFHTRFPEYAYDRIRFPISWGYALLRDFHNLGETMMVATPGMMEELDDKGFNNMKLWQRGVDTDLFKPMDTGDLFEGLPRPIMTYVGRFAIEKSLEDFLDLELPGTKVMVGHGPQEAELKKKYAGKNVHWAGTQYREELARHYAASDVFVFPSRTDTFGLVNVEALASGVPVASYPVRGPLEILGDAPEGAGCMDQDLKTAILKALEKRDPEQCRHQAMKFSWEAGAKQFISNLEIQGFDQDWWLRSAKMADEAILP